MSGIGHLALGAMQGLNAADAYHARRNSEKLAQSADQRSQKRFDMQTEAFDLEKEVKRRETAGKKLYALSLDDQGNPRKFSSQDNDYINRQVVPILNQGGIFNEFFTSNKDVDPTNPIATAHINEDNRVMIGLRMRDGSVRPATENKSSDPNDNLWSPSVEEFMRYAQIEADPRGAASRLAARQQQGYGLADFKEKQTFLTDEKLRLAKGYGILGMAPTRAAKKTDASGWKPDEAEKHIKALVATGMGLNNQNFANFSKDMQQAFSRKVAATLNEWRAHPELGVSGAYDKVIGSSETPAFNKLPKGQQNALAIEWLKKEKVQPEGSGMFDFGEQDYSSQQLDLAKAKLATGGDESASSPASIGNRYKGKDASGNEVIFTDADIESTAQKHGMTVEAVKRQLGIK